MIGIFYHIILYTVEFLTILTTNYIYNTMDEIQRAQLNKLNQMVVDGENLNEEQKELRRELYALQRALAVNAVATSPGDNTLYFL